MHILKLGQISRGAACRRGIPGRREEQGLYHIFRGSPLLVICFIQLLLERINHIRLHLAGRRGCAGFDIIHKHTELADSHLIHMVKLGHQPSDSFIDRLFIGEINRLFHGWMRYPHKIHVALRRLFRELLHFFLGADSYFGFFFCDLCGIIFIPFSQMIGVGLRSI